MYSDNALKIYQNLYFVDGETKPEHTHTRVAVAIADNDEQYEKFKYVLDEQIFRPNTPCLINAGIQTGSNKSLCACFIIGLEDTMDSITEMWKTCSLIYAAGGGAGMCISKLREKNGKLSGGGFSSGPISFMKVIQSISDVVKSGGRTRRAANMICFRYDHPDIMDFIVCKNNNNLSAANISILVDEAFFKAVENNENIQLISPHGEHKGEVSARDIWNKIIENAHKTGDPGLLFYDTINRTNPFPSRGDIVSTNPCGEVPLRDWSCCDLGSINLNKILDNDNNIDYDLFSKYIQIGVEFLDNVISKSEYPHVKFKETMMNERPIGLGIMGFADILYRKRIPYNSKEAIDLFSKICKHLTQTAFRHSIQLAKEKGSIYFDHHEKEHFVKILEYYGLDNNDIDDFRKYGIRNSQVTSIAPTGSISISADCSYSFEPIFALVWKKTLVDRNETLTFINSEFEKVIDTIPKNKDEIINDIIENKGSIQHLDYIPDDIKRVFVVAHDIEPKSRIDMQAAGQRYITLAISSTCNLPNSATIDDVAEIYNYARQTNSLKGITIYRDGSLDSQPVNFGGDKKKNNDDIKYKRPAVRFGKTVEIETPYGKLYLTGNYDKENRLIETFIRLGKQGTLISNLIDALSRSISKGLQNGVNIDTYVDSFIDTQGESFWFKFGDDEKGRSHMAYSLIDAIARIIQYHFTNSNNNNELGQKICPKCGLRTLIISSGCRGGSCYNCGYSSCG